MPADDRYRVSVTLFYGFFLAMVLEGAVRKWWLPGISIPLQVARDLLPTCALLAWLAVQPAVSGIGHAAPPRAILLALLAYFVIALASSFASGQESLAIPALGMRTHFAYVPLAFLVPALFDRVRLDRFLRTLVILAIPVCMLAAYQSTQPPGSWINQYADDAMQNASFGDEGLVRAAGTFSYITGMGFFAQFTAAAAFYLAMTSSSTRWRAVAYAGLAASVLGCFATGSRAALFTVLLQVILMMVFSPALRQRLMRRSSSNLAWVVIVAIALYLTASTQMAAFVQRTDQVSGDLTWRVASALTDWTEPLAEHPLGTGVGSGHQLAAVLLGGEGGFSSTLPESELSRVALELGIAGFLAFGVFRILVYVYAFATVRRARGDASILAALAFSTLLALVAGAIYNPMANALFWLSLGVCRMVRNEPAGIQLRAGSASNG